MVTPPTLRSLAIVAVATAALAAACVRPPLTARPMPPGATPPGHEETGLASWYGHPYHGRRTASGEVYDMSQMTAAHRTLPFGTWVLVESRVDGRAVEVRVIDRGPFKADRVVDLSHAAARVIGLVGAGTLPVRLRVLAGPAARSAGAPSGDVAAAAGTRGTPDAPGAGEAAPPGGAPVPAGPGRYAVQVAAFGDEARAAELRGRLEREGRADVAVDRADRGGVVLHRVRVGSFPTRSAAEAEAARLAGAGHAVIIVDR